MSSPENIKVLLDKVREINQSQKNKYNKKYWRLDGVKEINDDEFRVIPSRPRGERPPFYAELSIPMYSKILGFSVKDFYSDPLSYLENYLRMIIFNYQQFPDDNYVQKKIRIMFAAALEGSLFGLRYGITEQGNIWLDNEPLLNNKSDLTEIKFPDFYHSGMMPEAIEFYEQIAETIDDDFIVTFPAWVMGPFGLACRIRGFSQFLVDLIEDREFCRELLALIVNSRICWTKERSKYLNRPWAGGSLGNDDICCPTLSPQMYKNEVIEFEKQLKDFYSSIYYWHSCGDCTRLLPIIKKLSPISLLHVGPWTGVEAAVDIFGEDTPLEIALDPEGDVLRSTLQERKTRLNAIRRSCGEDVNCYIRLDSFDSSKKDCLSRVKEIGNYLKWAKISWHN